ncbi:transcriptional repressor LexA [Streptomyces sp. NPDC048638]|uniref:transcriptional repressor LexA n=1 Tax=Streptomyces sp. NPDC048638 TaxID=3365580 RepID=UPI00371D1E0A
MEAVTTTSRGRPPGDETGEDGLTDRQRRVLECIAESIEARGYPPSMREIGQAVGLNSTSSVAHQIGMLERKGALRRDPHRPRAYVVAATRSAPAPDEPSTEVPHPNVVHAPLVGRIAAGTPITAEQHIDDWYVLPRQIVSGGDLFILTVSGNSMIDAAIADGDHVVVRSQPACDNGDIVAAMIDGEATVKRFKRNATGVWLMPENKDYEPIPADEATILGRVTAVLRSV